MRTRYDTAVARKSTLHVRHLMNASNTLTSWIPCFALVLCCGIAKGQGPPPTHIGIFPDGQASTLMSLGDAQRDGSQPTTKPGNVLGTVLDPSGSPTSNVLVRLTKEDKAFSQQVATGDNGQFSF